MILEENLHVFYLPEFEWPQGIVGSYNFPYTNGEFFFGVSRVLYSGYLHELFGDDYLALHLADDFADDTSREPSIRLRGVTWSAKRLHY